MNHRRIQLFLCGCLVFGTGFSAAHGQEITLAPRAFDLPPLIEMQQELVPGPDMDNADARATQAVAAWRSGAYVKARVLAASAGAKGSASAKLLFGILLDQGLGGDADPVLAVQWYRAAAKEGEVDAFLALAGMAFAKRGGLILEDGRGFLVHAANAGNADAMLALGRAFASGHGGVLDEALAQKWLEQAIGQGSNPARVKLADLLLTQGKDKKALALYQTAAFGGSTEAAWKSGILQADPQSPVYAPDIAGKDLLQAAEAGNAKAMRAYGLFLAGGKPALFAQAARWFRKSANAKDAEGQYIYAIALAKGEGVVQDRESAFEWALRAAKNEPDNAEYEKLADVLRASLPPLIRKRVFARAQMPLQVSRRDASPRLTDGQGGSKANPTTDDGKQ